MDDTEDDVAEASFFLFFLLFFLNNCNFFVIFFFKRPQFGGYCDCLMFCTCISTCDSSSCDLFHTAKVKVKLHHNHVNRSKDSNKVEPSQRIG